MIARMDRETKENKKLKIIKTAKELEYAEREELNLALLTVEEGGVLNGNRNRLEELYQRGVRLITLTWNYENCIGYPNSRNAQEMQKGLKSFWKTGGRRNERKRNAGGCFSLVRWRLLGLYPAEQKTDYSVSF